MKQIYGVIGNPVGHSLSPDMHEEAFRELNINASYHAFLVPDNRLQQAVDGIRGLGIRGVNVTLPHKVEVMNFLDEIHPLAEEIGAVNTIVNENGKLTGYNTDGEGYVHGLMPILPKELKNIRALIIGAGGAAKAVAVTLAKYNIHGLVIANRTVEKAHELAKACEGWTDSSAINLGRAQARLTEFDLIINTTSIGMSPDTGKMPLSLETLSEGTVVSDLIYTPAKTRWLQDAEARGAIIQNGLDMFINQGALAFEKWTGQEAPREIMKKKVIGKLGGK
ncbi:shikimate dehydrogenase [Salipaludibacillus aurantiacus]|uniref:Shikimate dehydrogenase (NADP(+)) n=1 Tax=Salipaludibacillus aurantiacus TaxID=1601833 RepID=A0A1H9REX4_9BACI|nr:shikimate dehydrogenase [Salipaludibacillus aurantiacus]SER71350.1 shikimate dehydrogenase [Salipaludibacillus aurantiacus]